MKLEEKLLYQARFVFIQTEHNVRNIRSFSTLNRTTDRLLLVRQKRRWELISFHLQFQAFLKPKWIQQSR